MKKKIAALTAAALLVSMLSACGKDTSYLKGIDASKYVTLGAYKGIEVTEAQPEVSDEVVDYYIEAYILKPKAVATEVTDRTVVEDGDTVNIDYTGYRDGEPFENGSAQGDSLTIGSGRFIPGFEDGLIGAEIGKTVSLDLTFPEDYTNAEMAGVSVTFEVKVNSISIVEMPEFNDELVQGLGIEGCSTADELKDYLYQTFYNNAVESYNKAVKNDILNALTANCIFEEPPKNMVDRYYNIIIEELTARATASGMNLNTYIYNYYYMDEEGYKEYFRDSATETAKQYIMLQAVADAEGLNISNEELSKVIEERITELGYTSVDEFKEQVDEEDFKEYLMAEKVMEFLIENAVIKDE